MNDLLFTLLILGLVVLTLIYAARCVGLIGPADSATPSVRSETVKAKAPQSHGQHDDGRRRRLPVKDAGGRPAPV